MVWLSPEEAGAGSETQGPWSVRCLVFALDKTASPVSRMALDLGHQGQASSVGQRCGKAVAAWGGIRKWASDKKSWVQVYGRE